jgi:oligopeptide/dipeptide ABC transporter ATP-binding protein
MYLASEVERQRETILLAGDPPSPANPPPACRFHTRCPYIQETRCKTEVPRLRKLGGPTARLEAEFQLQFVGHPYSVRSVLRD